MATLDDLSAENEKLLAHFSGELWATRILLARLAVAVSPDAAGLDALCKPPVQAPDPPAFRPPAGTVLSGTDLDIIFTGTLRAYFSGVRDIAEADGWINHSTP